MNSKEVERRLLEGKWPEPSQDLRARVLTEATVPLPSIVWSDRIWFSRAWRLSMVALVVGVLTVRAWPVPDSSPLSDPSPQALAEAQAIRETGREIGLPDTMTALLARRALGQSRTRALTFNSPALQFLDQLDQEETRRD